MKTRGTVISIEGDKARVKVVRKSACDNCDACSSKGACHAEIMLSESNSEYELAVNNTVGAGVGDFVEIESSGNLPLVFALIIFLFPIVATVITAFAINSILTGGLAVAVDVVVFILTFLVCSFAVNRFSAKVCKNSICKIIKENSK